MNQRIANSDNSDIFYRSKFPNSIFDFDRLNIFQAVGRLNENQILDSIFNLHITFRVYDRNIAAMKPASIKCRSVATALLK